MDEEVTLIPCPLCKRETASNAHDCPACGYVFRNKERQTHRLAGVSYFFSLAVLFDVFMHNLAVFDAAHAKMFAVMSMFMLALFGVGACVVFDILVDGKPNRIVALLYQDRPWPWQRHPKQAAKPLQGPTAIPRHKRTKHPSKRR